MSTQESSLQTADVSAPPASSVTTTADSSSASQGSSAPSEQPAGTVPADVQGTTTETDPLAGVPSLDELNQLPDTTQYKKSLVQLRTAYEPLKTQLDELTQKFNPFQPVLERFEQPEKLQEIIALQDSLIGWENDPATGQPIPNTDKGAQLISEKYPQHADDLTYALLGMPTTDPMTGQQRERIDIVLAGMAADAEQRARALKILGGVEPSAIAPQWQPTEDELAVVRPELQDFYRTLPYEDRAELKENSPEFINKTLQQLKLTEDLQAERARYQQQEQQRQQQREQYINQQAQQAADQYVTEQLNSALTTFHESVVQQCNFIKPLDPANLPQGITAEQVPQLNQQIERANKAEAVQMTATVIGLLNPQVRAHILPLMKEVGLIDDKTLGKIEEAASGFGNNARNFGNLSYRGKLQANGNYQPDDSVTRFSNEASRNLKALVGLANQIRGALMETRSGFFELRAQQHNATLNGAGAVRPPINGTGFNPTTAPANAQRPTGWQTREEIARQYG